MPVRSRSPAPPAPGTSGQWAEWFVRAVTLDDYRVVAGHGLVLHRSAWRKMLLSHLCHLSHLSPESPDRPVCSRARRGDASNGVPFGQDGSLFKKVQTGVCGADRGWLCRSLRERLGPGEWDPAPARLRPNQRPSGRVARAGRTRRSRPRLTPPGPAVWRASWAAVSPRWASAGRCAPETSPGRGPRTTKPPSGRRWCAAGPATPPHRRRCRRTDRPRTAAIRAAAATPPTARSR